MTKQLVIHDELLAIGFIHEPSLLINGYSYDISYFEKQYRVIEVCLNPGNIYVYLRCGQLQDDRRYDAIICIFNGDIHGVLTKEWIENAIKLLKPTK